MLLSSVSKTVAMLHDIPVAQSARPGGCHAEGCSRSSVSKAVAMLHDARVAQPARRSRSSVSKAVALLTELHGHDGASVAYLPIYTGTLAKPIFCFDLIKKFFLLIYMHIPSGHLV